MEDKKSKRSEFRAEIETMVHYVAQHTTPGPWKVFAGTVIQATKRLPGGAEIDVSLASTFESSQFAPGCGDMFDETRANARLMAAAPELLAVLEEIAKNCEAQAVCSEENFEFLSIATTARAAIAKAKNGL